MGEDEDDGEGRTSGKDDRMLSSIFARTGVQTALEHDAIINGKKTVRADPETIAREAKRVAAEAARELERDALLFSVPTDYHNVIPKRRERVLLLLLVRRQRIQSCWTHLFTPGTRFGGCGKGEDRGSDVESPAS